MFRVFAMKLNINFYLKSKKAIVTNILISIHFKDKRLLLHTGMNIEPKYWDYASKRPRRGYRYEAETNRFFEYIRNGLNDYFYKNLNTVSIGELKKELSTLLRRDEVDSAIDTFDIFIQSYKDSNKFKYRTVQKYATCKNHLEGFLDSKGDLSFEHIIDKNFGLEFTNYLNIKKKITNDSALRYLKNVKTFLKWAVLNGYCNINLDGISSKLLRTTNKKNTGTIALTMAEVDCINSLALPNEALDKVRNMFLIQCFTGLRYSDLENLSPANVRSPDNEIELTMIKTAEPIIIPIHSKLKPIIEKYDYHPISNQKYNGHLKKLGELAGMVQDVKTVKYFGNERKDIIKKRWEMVTSHTGRRTFVTLMLKAGLMTEMVMQVTGHKSKASLELYVKLLQQESIKQVRDAWND